MKRFFLFLLLLTALASHAQLMPSYGDSFVYRTRGVAPINTRFGAISDSAAYSGAVATGMGFQVIRSQYRAGTNVYPFETMARNYPSLEVHVVINILPLDSTQNYPDSAAIDNIITNLGPVIDTHIAPYNIFYIAFQNEFLNKNYYRLDASSARRYAYFIKKASDLFKSKSARYFITDGGITGPPVDYFVYHYLDSTGQTAAAVNYLHQRFKPNQWAGVPNWASSGPYVDAIARYREYLSYVRNMPNVGGIDLHYPFPINDSTAIDTVCLVQTVEAYTALSGGKEVVFNEVGFFNQEGNIIKQAISTAAAIGTRYFILYNGPDTTNTGKDNYFTNRNGTALRPNGAAAKAHLVSLRSSTAATDLWWLYKNGKMRMPGYKNTDTTFFWTSDANGNVILKKVVAGTQGAITSENDPTVGAHIKAISTGNIANWNAAYSWGNHAAAGYALNSSLAAYVPASRTLTINGTTLDLSANRSYTVTAGGNYMHPYNGNALFYFGGDTAFHSLSGVNVSTFNNDAGYRSAALAGDTILLGVHGNRYNDLRFHPLENQRLSTTNSPTFAGITSAGYYIGSTLVIGQSGGNIYLQTPANSFIFNNAAGGTQNMVLSNAGALSVAGTGNFGSTVSGSDVNVSGATAPSLFMNGSLNFTRRGTGIASLGNGIRDDASGTLLLQTLTASGNVTGANLNVANWNTAYGWGNHAGLYRPISYVPTWSEVTGKPSFATVATSADYNDLINKPALGTAAVLNVPASGNAASGEVVKGNDTRLTDARTPAAHTHSESEVTNLVTDLAAIRKYNTTYSINNIVGQVWDDNFKRSSLGSNYTTAGTNATISLDGAKMNFSRPAAVGGFADYVQTAATYGWDRMVTQLKFVQTSSNTNDYGIGIGYGSVVTNSSNANLTVQFDAFDPAKVGKINFFNGNTTIKIGTANLAFSATDTILLSVFRDRDYIWATALNINSGVQIVEYYQYSLTATTYNLPNLSNMRIYSFGGTQQIVDFRVVSLAKKNVSTIFCGDSEFTGYVDGDVTTRIPERVYDQLIDQFDISSGGYERSTDMLKRLPEIALITPKKAVLEIGINEIATNSQAVYQANVDSFVNYLQQRGTQVILTTMIPTTAPNTTEVQYNNAVIAVAAKYGIPYLDLYNSPLNDGSGGLAAAYNSGDGTHKNAAGAKLIADSIRQYVTVNQEGDSSLYLRNRDLVTAGDIGFIEKGSGKLGIASTSAYFGMGTGSPQTKLHIISNIGSQLRLGYDQSNYFNTQVTSDGSTTWSIGSGGTTAAFTMTSPLYLTKDFSTATTPANGSLYAPLTSAYSGATPFLYGGASSTTYKVSLSGTAVPNPPFNSNITNVIIPSRGITETGSGTHPVIAGFTALAPAITDGVAATTVAANVYFDKAPTGITPTQGTYNIYAAAGNNYYGGKSIYAATITATGTTGNQTINNPSGSVNFAAGATSLVVTNNLVTTSSQIKIDVQGTTPIATSYVPAGGSFSIYLGTPPAAETKVTFLVIN